MLRLVSLKRWIACTVSLALVGGCLWRPPVIPPLASGNSDAGVRNSDDAAGVFTSDAGQPPPNGGDAGAEDPDRALCDGVAALLDGAVPGSVTLSDGRVVRCGPQDGGDGDAASDASDAASDDAPAGDD
ncbi:MAG: hypothetical protein Q8Q09_22685 [Deltaproteobacteria bacterium]|nr:hypothetical protein [Deltaproteobacteria bacterium]